MLLLQLFWTFLKIGIFTFGGGLAMISLIQNEVVGHYHWLTTSEFTDVLAVSQMTPGPIGINTATYAGYTAMVNAGYSPLLGILGAVTCSFAVVLIPVILMLIVCKFLQRYKDHPVVTTVIQLLRIAVVGLIAAAALSLLGTENFGQPGLNRRFICCCCIFTVVFMLSILPKGKKKPGPIALMLLSGVAGLLLL